MRIALAAVLLVGALAFVAAGELSCGGQICS
jgi:hypothetical protein